MLRKEDTTPVCPYVNDCSMALSIAGSLCHIDSLPDLAQMKKVGVTNHQLECFEFTVPVWWLASTLSSHPRCSHFEDDQLQTLSFILVTYPIEGTLT